MTTTLVRDSIVGDDWLRRTAQANPIQRVIDPATQQPTGDILTGPVRLSFVDLFTLPKPSPGMTSEPKFGATLLFTPMADMTILYEEFYKVCATKFAEKFDRGSQQYYGVRSPFRDQGEKMKFGGYTPQCVFLTCTSKFKPPVVDTRRNPITDPSKVYAGVWAICSINAYSYHDPKNMGVAFGLQSVMIIGDDTNLGVGGPDVNQAFANVNVTAPIVTPNITAGMPMGAAPPPAAAIPGYTTTGGGVAMPQGFMPQPHVSDDDDMSFLN